MGARKNGMMGTRLVFLIHILQVLDVHWHPVKKYFKDNLQKTEELNNVKQNLSQEF